MSENKTTDEYVSRFGAVDGEIVRTITYKACNLASQWRMFLYFYCGPIERVETLNAASGRVAHMFQGLLWDNALLRIRQLTDPVKSWSNDNLSLGQLVRIAGNIDLSHELAATQSDCASARTYVNKYLAHLDLAHATGSTISTIERGQTTKAVHSICNFVQLFHSRVRETDIDMMPVIQANSEEVFLLRLYQGIETEKLAKQAALDAAPGGNWRTGDRVDIPSWISDQRVSERFLDKD